MSLGDRILLAHGAGGQLTRELVEGVFAKILDNPILSTLSDSALLPELPPGRAAMTTDAFVVDPLIFEGGNLGYLSVCGTVNDLCMSGARPLYLTWALILEEGAEMSLIRTLAEGAARAADKAGITLVAGDTKVVPHGKGDRAFATTAGLGIVPEGRQISDARLQPGDAVIVSGSIGDHGATVFAHRHDLLAPGLCSDVRPLGNLVEVLFAAGFDLHSLHDPTRGGLATVCYETASRSGLSIRLEEAAIPITHEVGAICDLLGLDPLYLACEGRLVLFAPAEQALPILDIMRAHPDGQGAKLIGQVLPRAELPVPLVLHSPFGVDRPLDSLSGMDLPRIC
jgi:hydrogenase expression/formation protein HypE